jgi:hypothetical protein
VSFHGKYLSSEGLSIQGDWGTISPEMRLAASRLYR